MKQEVVILGGQTIDQKLKAGAQASKLGFYKLIVCIIKKKKKSHGVKQKCKNMPLLKQNVMKFEVFILGGQRIDQKRNKGWWRGSRERIEMEAEERG